LQPNFKNRVDRNQRNEEHRPRAPQVINPNVGVLEEIEEEYFIEESMNDQNQILESVQMVNFSQSNIQSGFQIWSWSERRMVKFDFV